MTGESIFYADVMREHSTNFAWNYIALESVSQKPYWRVKPKLRADEIPTLFEVSGNAGEFEIISVDSQDQLEVPVNEETLPAWDGGEPNGEQGFAAVPLPENTGQWVAIKSETEAHHGPTI